MEVGEKKAGRETGMRVNTARSTGCCFALAGLLLRDNPWPGGRVLAGTAVDSTCGRFISYGQCEDET